MWKIILKYTLNITAYHILWTNVQFKWPLFKFVTFPLSRLFTWVHSTTEYVNTTSFEYDLWKWRHLIYTNRTTEACFKTSGQIRPARKSHLCKKIIMIQKWLFKCNLTCDRAGNSAPENVPISVLWISITRTLLFPPTRFCQRLQQSVRAQFIWADLTRKMAGWLSA